MTKTATVAWPARQWPARCAARCARLDGALLPASERLLPTGAPAAPLHPADDHGCALGGRQDRRKARLSLRGPPALLRAALGRRAHLRLGLRCRQQQPRARALPAQRPCADRALLRDGLRRAQPQDRRLLRSPPGPGGQREQRGRRHAGAEDAGRRASRWAPPTRRRGPHSRSAGKIRHRGGGAGLALRSIGPQEAGACPQAPWLTTIPQQRMPIDTQARTSRPPARAPAAQT